MTRDSVKLWMLLGLGSVAAWLWLTRSGQSAAASAGSFIATTMSDLRRGERINNPMNIRKSASVWQGQSPDQTADSDFVSFTDPTFGIRAGALTLKNYARVHGIDTVQGAISRWAPSAENPTQSYVDNVSNALGVNPTDTIDLTDPETLKAMVTAMIQQEQGRVIYDDATIAQGVSMA